MFIAVSMLVWKLGIGGIMIVQLSCVLAPSLLYVKLTGISWENGLALRFPSSKVVAGSIALGGSVWFILISTVLVLQNLLFTPSEAFLAQRQELFFSSSGWWYWLFLWTAAALTPAICEEFLFRGVLFHVLRRRFGVWVSTLSVSILFALFHFNPYQLSITFLLGCVLAWLVVRTKSLFSSMIFHLLNNTMVLIVAQGEQETLSIWTSILLVLLAMFGVFLLECSNPEGSGRISSLLRCGDFDSWFPSQKNKKLEK
jgi:membrane protease YdiL (CAAX protease family)